MPGRPRRERAMPVWFAVTLTAVASAGTSLQARLNGELLGITGNAPQVSMINLVLGLAFIGSLTLAVPSLRAGVGRVIAALRSGGLRWWHLAGGLAGAFFVGVQSSAVPVVGVAVFTVAVVAGMTTSSVVVDRLGIGPAGVQAITGPRLAAAGLAVAAVVVAVSNRFGGEAGAASALLGMIALAFAAGAIGTFQAPLNGQVARVGGNMALGALSNYLFGAVAVTVVTGLLAALAGRGLGPVPWDQPWLLVGGLLGVAYVAVIARTVRSLGVLTSSLASVLGLLAGALGLDVLAPTPGTVVTWQVVAGTALSVVAVAVSLRRR